MSIQGTSVNNLRLAVVHFAAGRRGKGCIVSNMMGDIEQKEE